MAKERYFYCHYCGVELFSFVGSGWRDGENKEIVECPECHNEGSIRREDEDE